MFFAMRTLSAVARSVIRSEYGCLHIEPRPLSVDRASKNLVYTIQLRSSRVTLLLISSSPRLASRLPAVALLHRMAVDAMVESHDLDGSNGVTVQFNHEPSSSSPFWTLASPSDIFDQYIIFDAPETTSTSDNDSDLTNAGSNVAGEGAAVSGSGAVAVSGPDQSSSAASTVSASSLPELATVKMEAGAKEDEAEPLVRLQAFTLRSPQQHPQQLATASGSSNDGAGAFVDKACATLGRTVPGPQHQAVVAATAMGSFTNDSVLCNADLYAGFDGGCAPVTVAGRDSGENLEHHMLENSFAGIGGSDCALDLDHSHDPSAAMLRDRVLFFAAQNALAAGARENTDEFWWEASMAAQRQQAASGLMAADTTVVEPLYRHYPPRPDHINRSGTATEDGEFAPEDLMIHMLRPLPFVSGSYPSSSSSALVDGLTHLVATHFSPQSVSSGTSGRSSSRESHRIPYRQHHHAPYTDHLALQHQRRARSRSRCLSASGHRSRSRAAAASAAARANTPSAMRGSRRVASTSISPTRHDQRHLVVSRRLGDVSSSAPLPPAPMAAIPASGSVRMQRSASLGSEALQTDTDSSSILTTELHSEPAGFMTLRKQGSWMSGEPTTVTAGQRRAISGVLVPPSDAAVKPSLSRRHVSPSRVPSSTANTSGCRESSPKRRPSPLYLGHTRHSACDKSSTGNGSIAGSGGFVNFTPQDGHVLMTAVAQSGSSKTKARREREAEERRRRMEETAIAAVRAAGGEEAVGLLGDFRL